MIMSEQLSIILLYTLCNKYYIIVITRCCFVILECFYHVKGSDKLTNQKHCHENCYELIQTISNQGNFVIKNAIYPITYGAVFLINAIDIHCFVFSQLWFSAPLLCLSVTHTVVLIYLPYVLCHFDFYFVWLVE